MIGKKDLQGRGIHRMTFVAVLMFLFACTPAFSAKVKQGSTEPDYTKGEQPVQPDSPWALGAIGAFGHIWPGDQRMIQIESIANGSPAEGKLKECDVIVGVTSPKVNPGPQVRVDDTCRRPGCGASGKAGNCGHFTWEARRALSAAITEAEKAGGKLVLNVWRPETERVTVPPESRKAKPTTKLALKQPLSGTIVQVTLTLPRKGAFSASSPWKCEKTEALIADAAQAIVKEGLKGGIPGDLNALGLLSTGDEKYLPVVRDYARAQAQASEGLDIMGDKGINSWYGGYRNLLLTEYYLLTKDETVLPGIKALSQYLAYGQSGVGTWSHGMANVKEYAGWATTGQRLLQHCLPRKVLYLTGKGDSCLPPFTDAEVKEALDAGTFDPAGLSVKELLAALGNWSRVVRQSAAEELGQRKDDVVEPLIAMLDSPNRFARYGACTALRYCGRKSDKAVGSLANKVEHDKDMTLRFFAVGALHLLKQNDENALGNAVTKSTPALLKIAATYDPEQDAMRMLSGAISQMLFYGGHVQDYAGFFPDGKGTENLDRKLLIPAMKAWLINPNGSARSAASAVYQHLSEKDLEPLWAEIYYAAKYQAPANAMFANGVRANGFLVLAQNRFEEGIALGLDYLYQEGWGKFSRVPAAFNALAEYGSAMKPYLEEMRTREYEPYVNGRKPKEVKNCQTAWQKLLENIDKKVELRSIKPFLEATGMKEPEKVFPPKK